ncbi:MAG: hypothetical protein GX568_08440 [Candidatus Gastranaerophilales bacterium]|nr:hypothetical protein [Candidatus Gastranaerophilales bacterium]
MFETILITCLIILIVLTTVLVALVLMYMLKTLSVAIPLKKRETTATMMTSLPHSELTSPTVLNNSKQFGDSTISEEQERLSQDIILAEKEAKKQEEIKQESMQAQINLLSDAFTNTLTEVMTGKPVKTDKTDEKGS